MHILCPRCQTVIAWDEATAPNNMLCPACASTLPADVIAAARASAPPPRRLGKFELLEQVGTGSFGVVWKANDTELGRLVAVKIPFAGHFSSDTEKERFLREGRSAAQLRHPAIVPVHEVGHYEHLPYLVRDFIDGTTLADVMKNRRATFEESAEMVAQIADALEYAHAKGVVHRDIKPSNIMLERQPVGQSPYRGRPLLMDFGLALRRDVEETMTTEGELLGTPAYMSPEQAAGKGHEVDGRGDLYSLGVVLYRLLTRELPFRGLGRMILQQTLHDEPRPPRRLNDKVPQDLETITLKCLAKEPSRRYQTAAELAADIRCWQHGEPILARPVGRLERLGRWCRRNPVVASLGAATILLLAIVAVGATVAAVALSLAARRASLALEHEAAALRETELTLCDLHVSQGIMAGERNDPAQAMLWFAHAARLARHDPEREAANRTRFRAWSRLVPRPYRAFALEGEEFVQLSFHPGSRHLLARTRQDTCYIWHLDTVIWDLDKDHLRPWADSYNTIRAASWSPNGDLLALASDTGVELRRFPTGDVLETLPHDGPVRTLAFHPAGRFLVVAGKSARIWDMERRGFVPVDLAHPQEVLAIVFDPKGERIATGCLDGMARVFAFDHGASKEIRPLGSPVPHQTQHSSPAAAPAVMPMLMPPVFIDGGSGLLTVTANAGVHWRDAETGALVRSIPFRFGPVQFVIASPDGQSFALGGYSGAEIWDVAQAKPRGPVLSNRNFTIAAAFSANGRQLFTVSGDRTAQLWSVADCRRVGPPLPHQAILTLAACSPDGQFLATAQADGLIRVWMPPVESPDDHRIPLEGAPSFAKLDPTGKYVIATGPGWRRANLRTTRVFDISTGLAAGEPLEDRGLLLDAALSPDGRTAVTLNTMLSADRDRFAQIVEPEGRGGWAQLWDWRTGRRLYPIVPMPSEPRGVAFSPSGDRVVVICAGGQILILDPGYNKIVRRLEHGFQQSAHNTYPGVRFSPKGDCFATWGTDNTVQVWDAAGLSPRFPPLKHDGLTQDANFSDPGEWLVTSARDNTARLWNVANGEQLREPLRHPDWVFRACFRPLNVFQIVTACRDGMARVWMCDVVDAEPRHTSLSHSDEVFAAAFDQGGSVVLTAGLDRTLRIWEPQTGNLLAPPKRLDGWAWTVVAGDNARAVVAGEMPALLAVDLSDLHARDVLGVRELLRLGEILSGQRIDERGTLATLTTQEWFDSWSQFQDVRPGHPFLTALEPAAWHRQQAQLAEAKSQWADAIAHLDGMVTEGNTDWSLFQRRAKAQAGIGQRAQAVTDLTKAIELGAERWEVWLERALQHVESGDYRAAKEDYRAALERGAPSYWIASQYALLCLATGDRPAYRQACSSLYERFGQTGNPALCNNIGWVCTYAPNAIDNLDEVIGIVRKVLVTYPKQHGYLNTLGGLLCRAGRYPEAIDVLQQAMKVHPRGGVVDDWLFLALACHGCGRKTEAEAYLQKATAWIDQAKSLHWIERLELRIFRAEAESLLGASAPSQR